MVIYTIPSSSYQPGSTPAPTLDEVEILGPPPTLSQGGSSADKTAKFKLNVNGSTLHNVVTKITLTRMQDINNSTASPANGVWGYAGFPSAAPVTEATWTMSGSATLNVGDKPVFSIGFNPTSTGQYRFTYRVEATELAVPVETYQDIVVVN